MSADNQARHERQIFRTFAEDAGLGIAPKSIRSAQPPQPDIGCRTNIGDRLTFELVQVVDNGFAKGINDQIELQELLQEECCALPQDRSARLTRRLHNALVGVWFVVGASQKAKTAVIPNIISILEKVDITTEGKLSLSGYASLRQIVMQLMISRGEFVGPCFNVAAGGVVGERVIERVREKFSKSYQTSAPIELLAFYHLQPASPDDLWLPKLHEFVTANLDCSPFQRVWIYDAVGRKVRYMHPSEGKEKYYPRDSCGDLM